MVRTEYATGPRFARSSRPNGDRAPITHATENTGTWQVRPVNSARAVLPVPGRPLKTISIIPHSATNGSRAARTARGIGRFGPGGRIDEHVAHLSFGNGSTTVLDHDPSRQRRGAEACHLELQVQLVVEAGRPQIPGRCCRDDQVGGAAALRPVRADRFPEELREDHIEIDEVLGVEDDSLRIALVVANSQPVVESGRHGVRPQ